MASLLFWTALAVIAYTYVGYALLTTLLARWRPRPIHKAHTTPTVTMLVTAYNESDCIAAKIENTLGLDYPPDKLDLIVITDGSTDGTERIVARYLGDRVRLLHQPERQGKAAALARGLPLAHGEVLAFSDANCLFAPQALRVLVRSLADPQVGGVSGAKRVTGGHGVAQGEGLYWRYEDYVKRCDSAWGSVMGAPGEIWAVRREAYTPAEPHVILDDFVASMRIVARGGRLAYEPEAACYEPPSPRLQDAWERRVRVAAGGWQAVVMLPDLLRARPSVTLQYISHRVLRWVAAPGLFVVLALANLALLGRPFYNVFGAAQLLFYVLAALGWVLAMRGARTGMLTAPYYACLLNAAALAGGWRYLAGKQTVLWRTTREASS